MTMLVSAVVDEVIDTWRSYVREQNPVTATSGTFDADDLSFTVDDASRVTVGLIQVGDEMVQVRSVDRTTSTVTLEAWGRGQMASTAVSHSIGSKVTSAPTVPRVRVRDALSDVMQEVFPGLFAVDEVLLTATPALVRYSLPADAYHVLTVSYLPPGPSLSWIPIKRWRQNKTPSSLELEILSRVTPGADRVRVFYIKEPPGELVMSDDLETLGYPTSIRGVLVLGATARLAAFTETSRVQTGSVESAARAEAVPAGSSMNLSRYLYQLFRQRLDDESANLRLRYPIVSHFTR